MLLCFLIPVVIQAQTNTLDDTNSRKLQQTITPYDKEAVRVSGQVSSFTMKPGEVDQTIILKDSVNELIVLFEGLLQ